MSDSFVSSPENNSNNDEVAALSSNQNNDNVIASSANKKMRLIEKMICFLFFILALLITLIPINPRQRPIPYQKLESSGEYVYNLSYNEVLNGETVSGLFMLFMAYVLPFAIQLTLSRVCGIAATTTHNTVCVYHLGFGINGIVTGVLKLYVGYLRPVFYEMCQANDSFNECMSETETLGGDSNEGRKSFPSGHASWSFTGLTLLSLFLEYRFGMTQFRKLSTTVMMIPSKDEGDSENSVNDNTHSHPRRRKVIIGPSNDNKRHKPIQFYRMVSLACYLPMVLAGFIAVSRVVDNKHFPVDVVGGSVLGYAVASLVHSMWYPSWPLTIESELMLESFSYENEFES